MNVLSKILWMVCVFSTLYGMANVETKKTEKTENRLGKESTPKDKSILKQDINSEEVALGLEVFGKYSAEESRLIGGIADVKSLHEKIRASHEKVFASEETGTDVVRADQLIHHQIALLLPFRGLMYRLQPLFKKLFNQTVSQFGEAELIFKWVGLPLVDYLPHWEKTTLRDYLATPADLETNRFINNGNELIEWAKEDVYPVLNKYSIYLKKFGDQQILQWPSSIPLLEMNRMTLNRDATTVDISKVSFVLAKLHWQMSRILKLNAMEMGRYFDVLSSLKNRGLMSAQFEISMSEDLVSYFKKEKKLFTLKDDKVSLSNLKIALHHLVQFGEFSQKLSGSPISTTAPRRIASVGPLSADPFLPKLAQIQIIKTEQTVKMKWHGSDINIDADLNALFLNPPKDFKVFLPNQFLKGPKMRLSKVGEKTIPYLNHRHGIANGWNDEVYKTFFPGIQNDSDVSFLYSQLSLLAIDMNNGFAMPFLIF